MQKYVFDGAENNRKRNMLTQQILLELFSVFFQSVLFFFKLFLAIGDKNQG